MDRCFVIQPFDHGPFDKRYEDVVEPAIRAAGLEPYRVDRDPSVTIPIEHIEENIRGSRACVAEISTDNANVWYELGFAVASNRDVVLLASREARQRFPFDIQHRSVILYAADSRRDFTELESKITVVRDPEETSGRSCGLHPGGRRCIFRRAVSARDGCARHHRHGFAWPWGSRSVLCHQAIYECRGIHRRRDGRWNSKFATKGSRNEQGWAR